MLRYKLTVYIFRSCTLWELLLDSKCK